MFLVPSLSESCRKLTTVASWQVNTHRDLLGYLQTLHLFPPGL